MAWIDDPTAASSGQDAADLLDLYQQMAEPQTGIVDNILKVHSGHPAGMAAHFQLYRAVMAGTKSLRKVDREMIALIVSRLNECHY